MKRIWLIGILLLVSILFGCSQDIQEPTAETTSSQTENVESVGETQQQSDFPQKPIEMIVPVPAGSSSDIVARIIAGAASEYLPNGTEVVIINKPGGKNTIGVTDVFKADPDGYTIGFVPSSTITVEPHYGNTPYTYDSFQTIMRVFQQDGFLYVRSDSPFETFEQWHDYVKENPGKFNVGSVAGAVSLFKRLNHEGLETTFVPYDGFNEGVTALLGGHIEGVFAVPAVVSAQLESGEFRPLFTSSNRSFNGVPSLTDQGINIEEIKVTGIIAPKELPEDILTVLHDSFKQVLEDPEVIAKLKDVNVDPFYGNPEEYQQALTDGYHQDGETLKIVGLIE